MDPLAPHTGTYRTGPIGRFLRLLLGIGIAISLLSVVDQGGPASFHDPSNLTEPITIVLHIAAPTIFLILVGELAAATTSEVAARRWQRLAFAALVVTLATAAVVSWLVSGEVWASPLSDLVWGFDVLMLTQTIVALLFAIVLGTPGCEIGVWRELIARARGDRSARPPLCVLGLHYIDEWEHRRRSYA
jgi:hypothetical protein